VTSADDSGSPSLSAESVVEHQTPRTRSSVSSDMHPTAQRILEAARRIVTKRGFRALTLQAISTEAGVNKAGVWYYFGGKQQLVLALLEEVTVAESHHFGIRPRPDSTLDERIDLIVGSVAQVKARVERFAAFYEFLPEASRDADLHKRLTAYYRGWYAWAGEVLAPAGSDAVPDGLTSATIGQFASILLDGIFMQIAIGTPEFDLDAALEHARCTLKLLLAPETEPADADTPDRRETGDRRIPIADGP